MWLGPKGGTLPFEWTYVQWLVTLAFMPTAATVIAGAVRLLGGPGWVQLLAVLYGATLGAYLAVRAMRNVTFDEPLKHKTATVRSEFARTRRPQQVATSWVWAALPLADLSQPAVQLLNPREDT